MSLQVRNSIRLKLVVMIGLLALISAGAFALAVEQLGRSQALEHATRLQRHLTSRMASQLAQEMNARAAELKFLGTLDRMRDPNRSAEEKRDLLLSMKASYPIYAWLGVTDAKGTIIANTESRLDGVNVAHRSWFVKGREGVFFEDVHSAILLSQLLTPAKLDEAPLRLLDVAIPLYDKSNQFIGVLAGHLSLDWAYQARELLTSELDTTALDLLVVNKDDEVMIGKRDQVSLKTDLSRLNTVKDSRRGQQSTGMETWPNGARYLTTAAPVREHGDFPGLGWTVVVRTSEATAVSSAKPLTEAALIGGLAGALVFSLPLWWLVNRQLLPLERVTSAAKRLEASPDASPNLPIPEGDGEVAVFARTLSAMVNELRETKARYEFLFEHAPVAMAFADADGKLLNTNERFDALFGQKGQEGVHTVDEWFVRCFPDVARREKARSQWDRAIRKVGGASTLIPSGEYTLRTFNGDERIVAIEGLAMQDGLLLAFQDQTERRRAEAGLQLWAEAFKQSAIGIVIVDAQKDQIISANPEFAHQRGYTPEELVGLPIALLYPEDEFEIAQKIIPELAHKIHAIVETRHLTRDGRAFPVLIDVTVLHDADDKPTTRVAYVQDLTDRKRAEAEVLRLNAELEQRVIERTAELTAANKELDTFAYSVSHDLRAPLRTVNGFAQLLEADFAASLNEEARDYLKRIQTGTRKMAELIEGLLALSNFSRSVIERSSIDVTAMAKRRLSELMAAEPARQAEVDVEPDLHVTGDPRMVDALLTNLIDNAWKYSGKTERSRIRVFHGQVKRLEGICVSDNGAGFDMAKAGHLFEPFQRLHLPSQFQGTGVGLATVKRIVDRHGGRITVEAEPGHGATFCFTLQPDSEASSRY